MTRHFRLQMCVGWCQMQTSSYARHIQYCIWFSYREQRMRHWFRNKEDNIISPLFLVEAVLAIPSLLKRPVYNCMFVVCYSMGKYLIYVGIQTRKNQILFCFSSEVVGNNLSLRVWSWLVGVMPRWCAGFASKFCLLRSETKWNEIRFACVSLLEAKKLVNIYSVFSLHIFRFEAKNNKVFSFK
jgi:hypothetical protein